MAPTKPTVEHTVDRTPEYEKFIQDLRVFHEKRGTNFDPEPKMGNVTVDLLKLFKYIVAHGGYDKVSDEKLMWRRMCEGLGLMRHNAPADAYTLKQIFYKNLAAYEIKTIHNKEPPPPEILEFTTAKGGSLLTRTLETFQAKTKADREESTEDGTPSRERRPDETPTSGRAARGLREAPPPRVVFQPDTNPSRQTRHASGHHTAAATSASHSHSQPQSHSTSHPHGSTPIPLHAPNRGGASHIYIPPGPDGSNPLVQSYQPPALQQVPLRIVDTPASNPELFARKQRLLRQPQVAGPNPGALVRASLPPGTLDGPNIYERCLLSLRSGILAEQAFGLNHLVKISYERGDKYKFSQFSGLAEGLTEFALRVGNMFYDVDWTISNDPDFDEDGIGVLDGIYGTADILERIAQLNPKDVHDNFQPAEFTDELTLVIEAVLTIRNMVMLPDNAYFMAEYPPMKDLLCILLHLPPLEMVVELKHFALEIAEQMTPYLVLDSEDPLYKTLLAQLESSKHHGDRGIIVTALRAIGRIAMHHPTETNKLGGVPPSALQSIMDWLMINDEELQDACLDFLYQFTAVVPNLDMMLKETNVEHLVTQLVRLLSHGAKKSHREIVVSEAHLAYEPPSERIPPIPGDLRNRLLAMEEPERCYTWLRCFFEEDPDSQITQIAIWQAYNQAFNEPLKRQGRPMIQAPDFIRHISAVYQSAGAQVIREGPMGEVQKFIMRGIRSRSHPTTPEGQAYSQCQWRRPPGQQPAKCGVWNLTMEKMWEHIVTDHLGESRSEDGKYQNREGTYTCAWDTCTKYQQPTKLHLAHLMTHIKTHLKAEELRRAAATLQQSGDGGGSGGASSHPPPPPSSSHGGGVAAAPPRRPKPRVVKPAKTITVTYEETPSQRDERNPNAPPQAAGIPYSAALILRNIARNVVKTPSEEALLKQGREDDGGEEGQEGQEGEGGGGEGGEGGWNERLFRPVMQRLWEVFTENRLLASYMADLFKLLNQRRDMFAFNE
ncbi:hypothetical protein VTK56DRAFT_1007 [Thermocarpiscus australiensis]